MFNPLPALAGVSSSVLSDSQTSQSQAPSRLSAMLSGSIRGRGLGRGAPSVSAQVAHGAPEPAPSAASEAASEASSTPASALPPEFVDYVEVMGHNIAFLRDQLGEVRGELAALNGRGSDSQRVFLARTEMLTENVLLQAGLEWSDIEEVLCVGGSSRMPMVREMLLAATGRKPLLYEPDECIAKGAAIQARLIQNCGDLPEVTVGHVLSHSLGVATAIEEEVVIDHIVPALTPLPCTQIRSGYTTLIDNQSSVKILIYEGESSEMQSYREPIGSFELDTTPLRPAGQPLIQVEFRCDENGRIIAFARDEDTGRESRSMITLQGERSHLDTAKEIELLSRAVVH